MPTQDGFDPAHPMPQFLADLAQLDARNARHEAAKASPVRKAGILILAAAATGIAALAIGNPAALFADLPASLADNASPQPAPAIQSTADAPVAIPTVADAQALPPTAKDAPAPDQIAASEPAGKDQAEKSEASSEALFRQFQAWAAQQDAQAPGGLAPPDQDAAAKPVQNVPAPAAENASAPHRLVQKRRPVRAVRNARAELRTQNLRKQAAAQTARAERPPTQDARAQEQSGQSAQPSSLLPIFGR